MVADKGDIAFVAVQVIVTLALPDADACVVLVAVTVTAEGDGTAAGAVYSAVVALLSAIVPTVELPPDALLTLHVTSVEAPFAPVTVAVKTCAPPVATKAAAGETVTTIFGGGGGGAEDAAPVDPAQDDSRTEHTQRITKQSTGA
jgi:hypothetical protein